MTKDASIASWRLVRRWFSISAALLVCGGLSAFPGAASSQAFDAVVGGPTWTVESDKIDARFGESVATAGDVNGDGFSDVIVGAWRFDDDQNLEGRAYVFHGSAGGLETAAAWFSDGDQVGAWHGGSVATAGDVNGDGYDDVLVGGTNWDNPESNEGRALLYLGSSSGLAASAAWSFESDQIEAQLGNAVSTAGDVNGDGYADVVVAASKYDGSVLEVDSGRVYVFLGSSGGLGATPAAILEDGHAGSLFGYSVGPAGDVNADGYADVVVGAYLDDTASGNAGRVFVYLGSAGGLQTTAAWTAEGDQSGARLGSSVCTAGDVDGDGYADLLVGARTYDDLEVDEGAVFLFRGSAFGPESNAAWSAYGGQAGARFGYSVATAGDLDGNGYADVIVGASLYDDTVADEGAAYVYLGSAAGLATEATHTSYGGQTLAEYGRAVATAGDVDGDGYSEVIVGAHLYDNGELEEGRAYVYRGSADLPPAAPDPIVGGPVPVVWLTLFGNAMAAAGDVNGDGFGDLIVGSPYYSLTAERFGAAQLFHGSADGPESTPAWTMVSDRRLSYFGFSVANAGDVNGDGFNDVIVGAPFHGSYPNLMFGAAFVYLGSPGGLASSADWTTVSTLNFTSFGHCVASAGDVNGDGYADVAVGAPWHETGNETGRVFVYLGSPTGLAGSAAWMADGANIHDRFGLSVSTAGDVNGDGFDDLIVGATHAGDDASAEGIVYVYLGSPAGLGASPHWSGDIDQPGANLGEVVGTAGDVNGDGYADVFATSTRYDGGEVNEGAVFVWHGGPDGLGPEGSPANVDVVLEIDQTDAYFGCSAAAAGDVDGDGYGDLVAGSELYDDVEQDEGGVFLFLGSASGLQTSWAWSAEGQQTSAGLGYAVDGAADYDGDGFIDLVASAPGYDLVPSDQRGAVFSFPGNGARGAARFPGQWQRFGGDRVVLGSTTAPFTGFRLEGLGRTAAGRGEVTLETEVAPLGTALDGAGAVTGAPADTGAPGPAGSAVEQAANFDGLEYGTPYHWRLRWTSTDPFFPRSPWFALPGNTVTETKLRTPRVGVRGPATHAGKRGTHRIRLP